MLLYKYCDRRGLDIVRNRRLKVTPLHHLNDPMELSWRMEDERRYGELGVGSHDRFLGVLGETIGLVCLSESCDDLLCWSHYAAGHTGLVVGFDTSRFPEPLRSQLKPVRYSDDRVVWDGEREDLLFTKAEAWRYEREWRAMLGLPACAHARVRLFQRAHFWPIPTESIVKLILGARFPMRKRLRSVLWACGLNLPAEVSVERAVVSGGRYALEFRTVLKADLDTVYAGREDKRSRSRGE